MCTGEGRVMKQQRETREKQLKVMSDRGENEAVKMTRKKNTVKAGWMRRLEKRGNSNAYGNGKLMETLYTR